METVSSANSKTASRGGRRLLLDHAYRQSTQFSRVYHFSEDQLPHSRSPCWPFSSKRLCYERASHDGSGGRLKMKSAVLLAATGARLFSTFW